MFFQMILKMLLLNSIKNCRISKVSIKHSEIQSLNFAHDQVQLITLMLRIQSQYKNTFFFQAAGFLGVLSSELSVFTLAVITLERNYAITHAMHLNKRLSLKHAAYIMCGGWSFALLMATMPLLGISDYRKFAVCLPFETQDGLSLGFVIFLMLINGVAFSILMGCYLKMYCAIRGSQVITHLELFLDQFFGKKPK